MCLQYLSIVEKEAKKQRKAASKKRSAAPGSATASAAGTASSDARGDASGGVTGSSGITSKEFVLNQHKDSSPKAAAEATATAKNAKPLKLSFREEQVTSLRFPSLRLAARRCPMPVGSIDGQQKHRCGNGVSFLPKCMWEGPAWGSACRAGPPPTLLRTQSQSTAVSQGLQGARLERKPALAWPHLARLACQSCVGHAAAVHAPGTSTAGGRRWRRRSRPTQTLHQPGNLVQCFLQDMQRLFLEMGETKLPAGGAGATKQGR